uniref:NADH-ubiquinone oxidoreductase chain 4 n=1 Tax=Sphaeroma terebrans TaxID=180402 RepID=A0A5J6NI30_SPHTE|nr:NADH dehydrogenase subunit 4 [Sphaeroma terebrans]
MMIITLSCLLTLLFTSSFSALLFNLLLISFMSIWTSFHYLEYFHLHSWFYWDSVSSPLISLSVWITVLSVAASAKIYFNRLSYQMFSKTMTFLLLTLIVTLSVNDSLYFYILFEISLIPTFILILGWGYQPERLQAGLYMLLYTVLASLPLLILLLLWGYWSANSKFMFLSHMNLNRSMSILWFITSMTAFSVKLPMFILHLWLPKAHTEAPVAGSMILAGILLKLGGYGFIRLTPKLSNLLPLWGSFWIVWAMLGGVLVSILCLTQTDIKLLIALSSVAHMAMVVSGILTLSLWGVNGAMLIMIGHGFCSSGLFFAANASYERSHSRNLKIMKGMLTVTPAFSFWWFLLATSNMAAPPSLNLFGEIHSIISLVSWATPLLLPIAGLVFMAAGYSLYLYSATQHGKISMLQIPSTPASPRELLILTLHWVPLNIFILNPLFISV